MIRILTDSSCEFTKEEFEDLNIECIPLKVEIEGKSYLQNEIPHEKFYQVLKTSEILPHTSQPSPYDFFKIFSDVAAKKDTMIVILIGSKLSGTIQSAEIAKEMVGYDNIHIIDSNTTVGAMQILIYECLRLIKQNISITEIVSRINKLKDRICLYAIVDTLEYLKKGGRLATSKAMIGNLLHVKPIIALKGNVEVVASAIGKKMAIEKVYKLVKESQIDENYEIIYGYSGTRTNLISLEKRLKNIVNKNKIKEFSAGPVIGTHVGEGAAVIIYVKKRS